MILRISITPLLTFLIVSPSLSLSRSSALRIALSAAELTYSTSAISRIKLSFASHSSVILASNVLTVTWSILPSGAMTCLPFSS